MIVYKLLDVVEGVEVCRGYVRTLVEAHTEVRTKSVTYVDALDVPTDQASIVAMLNGDDAFKRRAMYEVTARKALKLLPPQAEGPQA